MSSDPWMPQEPGIGPRALAVLLTAITSAVGLAGWFLLRQAILALLALSGISPYAWPFVDKIGVLLLAGLWLAVTYLADHWYGVALRRRRLWRTFGRVSLVEGAALALTWSFLQFCR